MNDSAESLYQLAGQLDEYDALSLRAKALLAHEHRNDREAMRVFSFVWQRNARIMARAVERFPDYFNADESERPMSADDYLSVFAMAQLSRADCALLWHEWQDKTLAAWQVRQRVDKLKQRAPRVKRETISSIIDECARIAEGYSDGDELDTVCRLIANDIRAIKARKVGK